MSLRIAPLHNSRYYGRSSRKHCGLRQLRAANAREVDMAKAHTVFVYGTLLSEEIVQILLKRYPEVHKASVQGYSRYRIQGRVYPAILPTIPDDKLEGLVLCGLNEREFEILDEYEDEDYYRTQVTAQKDDGQSVSADIYVWKDHMRNLLYGEWDYAEFCRLHLDEYKEMCKDFGADFTSKDMIL